MGCLFSKCKQGIHLILSQFFAAKIIWQTLVYVEKKKKQVIFQQVGKMHLHLNQLLLIRLHILRFQFFPSLVLLPLAFLPFGLGLGFARTRFGDWDGLLALGVVQGLLQCAGPGPQTGAWVTLSPGLKAIFTISSKVLLPVARHFALHLSGLLVTWSLSEAGAAVSVARDTVAIAPITAIRSGLWCLGFLLLVLAGRRHSVDGDQSHQEHHEHSFHLRFRFPQISHKPGPGISGISLFPFPQVLLRDITSHNS